MKNTKSHLGLTALLAGISLITACDKLNGANKAPAVPAQAQQPQAQLPQQAQPQQQTQPQQQVQPQPTAAPQANQQPNQHPLPPVENAAPEADALVVLANQSIKIIPTGRGYAADKNKNQGSQITYHIENTGKKPINAVKWVAEFTSNNQVILSKEVGLNFAQQVLNVGGKADIPVLDLFKTMPSQTRAIFKDPNKQISITITPREISFTDGSKIVLPTNE